jgi:nicotinate-nucleotide adenylyltransferase
MKKLGIFGGTFDPPHRGHLVVAEDVRRIVGLDELMFIPSCISPHKQTRVITAPEHRLAMVGLATQGRPGVTVSDMEIRRGGVSYTVDTVRALRAENPAVGLFVVIGLDNIEDFWNWKDPEEILEMADLIAMTRPGVARPSLDAFRGHNVRIVEVTPVDAASSEIRLRLAAGLDVSSLISPGVLQYIQMNGLYGRP